MTELSVKVSQTINAPIKSVYNAWLDPEMLAKFMMPAENMTVPKVEVDAREGGRFTIIMATSENEIPHAGEYKKLQPFSQIIFTWESPFSIEGSTVTVNLSESKDATKIEIIHIKFPNEESRNNHEGGWTSILKCLDGIYK